MGLDQYLMAEQRIAAGSRKHTVIANALTDDHRKQLEDEVYGNSCYISGWDLEGSAMKPETAFQILVNLTGMVPDKSSPHFSLEVDGKDLIVRTPAMYWRKANAIHEWFVQQVQEGVDDCQLSRPVNGEELAELLDRCKQVIETPLLAAKLLPTQSGFFFGSVDYDEYYIQDLQHTVERLTQVFESFPKPLVLRYVSSW